MEFAEPIQRHVVCATKTYISVAEKKSRFSSGKCVFQKCGNPVTSRIVYQRDQDFIPSKWLKRQFEALKCPPQFFQILIEGNHRYGQHERDFRLSRFRV